MAVIIMMARRGASWRGENHNDVCKCDTAPWRSCTLYMLCMPSVYGTRSGRNDSTSPR